MNGSKLIILTLVIAGGLALSASHRQGFSKSFVSHSEDISIADLPVTEFFHQEKGDQYVILFTGDGGWKPLVTEMAEYFNTENISVVGIDVKKYLWQKKTPEQISSDLSKLIQYYDTRWHKKEVILVGYSMGADVLPFAVNRLSAELVKEISNLVLIAPYQYAQFEVKLINYIATPQEGALVLPEIEKLKVSSVFTICDDDDYALCKKMNDNWDHIMLEGGHHFGNEYKKLNRIIGQKIGLER